MGLFSKKSTYKLSFYYSVLTPNKLGLTILNTKDDSVENHFIELDNVRKVDEFFANDKVVINNIFDILNKIKDYDKNVSLVLLDDSLVYSYIAPKMSKNKVESFLNKELKENFLDLSKKCCVFTQEMASSNEGTFISVIFIRKFLNDNFTKLFKDADLILSSTYTYENVFGEFINKQVEDSNYLILNVRKNFTSIILVINNKVVDYITFKTDLDNASRIRRNLYSLMYKHAYSYEKIHVSRLYVSSNLDLEETWLNSLQIQDLFDVKLVPFGLRDFDRYKFNYTSSYKEKKLFDMKKSFDLKKFLSMDISFGKKKGFTLVECVTCLAIIAILGVTVFASILLANNLKVKEYNETFVSNVVKNLHSSFLANPDDAINSVYKSYGSNKVEEKLDATISNSKTYTFNLNDDYQILEADASKMYVFDVIYSVEPLTSKTGVSSYSLTLLRASLNEDILLNEKIEFGNIYVQK